MLSLHLVIDRDSSRAVEAQGIPHQVKRFTFISRLVLLRNCFTLLMALFRQEVLSLFLLQQTHLRDYRSESVWNEVWEDSLSCTTANGITTDEEHLLFTRQRRPPKRLENAVITEMLGHRSNPSSNDDYCSQYYYPVINNLLAELDLCFSNMN